MAIDTYLKVPNSYDVKKGTTLEAYRDLLPDKFTEELCHDMRMDLLMIRVFLCLEFDNALRKVEKRWNSKMQRLVTDARNSLNEIDLELERIEEELKLQI